MVMRSSDFALHAGGPMWVLWRAATRVHAHMHRLWQKAPGHVTVADNKKY